MDKQTQEAEMRVGDTFQLDAHDQVCNLAEQKPRSEGVSSCMEWAMDGQGACAGV